MKDFCIITNSNENILLKLGATLGAANINIEGLCLVSDEKKCTIHFAVEEAEKTENILKNSKIHILSISDVYVFDKDEKQVAGKPGSFGQICQTLAENNISIQFGYPAEHNRFIFGVDNIEKTTEILK